MHHARCGTFALGEERQLQAVNHQGYPLAQSLEAGNTRRVSTINVQDTEKTFSQVRSKGL